MVSGLSEKLRFRDSVTIQMVLLAALVIMPLSLLVMPGEHTFKRPVNGRQVSRGLTVFQVRPPTLAGHRSILPRLRHAVVRLHKAIRRRLHNAIHWLRVYRVDSNRSIRSDRGVAFLPLLPADGGEAGRRGPG